MTDPVMNQEAAGLFGVKIATLVAGFAGGVVSLSFLRGLSTVQAILAVFTGTATATYLTPLIMHYIGIPPVLENGAAFFVGLSAMNIIPGVLKLSDAFGKNPSRTLGRILSRKEGGEK